MGEGGRSNGTRLHMESDTTSDEHSNVSIDVYNLVDDSSGNANERCLEDCNNTNQTDHENNNCIISV